MTVTNDPLFPEGPEQAAKNFAEAIRDYGVPGDSRNPVIAIPAIPINRRMDVTINPDAMFMCSHGHLQYNLNETEKSEQRERGIDPPGDVYEGMKCRNCDERIVLLTSDPKELQQKLSTQMMAITALREQLKPLQAINEGHNRIALWMRGEYAYEINSGQWQHSGDLAQAVIYYMKIERGRWRVMLARAVRWMKRLIAAGGN